MDEASELVSTFKQENENGRVEEFEVWKITRADGSQTATVKLKSVESKPLKYRSTKRKDDE